MAQPLEIYYPDNAPEPNEEDLNRLRQSFRDAFLAELGDDYEIVQEPGPDVLTVLAQIIDLKITGALGTYEATGRLYRDHRDHAVHRGYAQHRRRR